MVWGVDIILSFSKCLSSYPNTTICKAIFFPQNLRCHSFLDQISMCPWSYFWTGHYVYNCPVYSGANNTVLIINYVMCLPLAPLDPLPCFCILSWALGGWLQRTTTTASLSLASGWVYPLGRSGRRLEGRKWERWRYLFSWLVPSGYPWSVCVPGQKVTSPLNLAISTQPSLLGSATCPLLSHLWALSWLTTQHVLGKLHNPLWFSYSLSTHTFVNSPFIKSFSNYTNLSVSSVSCSSISNIRRLYLLLYLCLSI